MSDILQAMALLIRCFHRYAGKDGDADTLSKGELSELLKNELSDELGKAPDKAAVDRMFQDLDANKDNRVDFTEFMKMVTCITLMCEEFFKKH